MRRYYDKFKRRFVSLTLAVLMFHLLNFCFHLSLCGQLKTSHIPYPAGTKRCGGVVVRTVKMAKLPQTVLLHKFTIVPTYEQSVTAGERVVLQEAINEWGALLDSCWYAVANYPITMRFAPIATDGVLAQTVTSVEPDDGRIVGAVIEFDNDASTHWYVDPDPTTDDEFHSDNPPDSIDLLSVARHEIGHAIGWTPSRRVFNMLSGVILDPPGLNIATVGDTAHTDSNLHPDDLMNTSMGTGYRLSIAIYPDVALVSKAYWYWVPKIRCIDLSYSGPMDGSLYKPWFDAMEGLLATPTGSTLIAMQGVYPLFLPTTRTTSMTIIAPRGKDAIIFSVFNGDVNK